MFGRFLPKEVYNYWLSTSAPGVQIQYLFIMNLKTTMHSHHSNLQKEVVFNFLQDKNCIRFCLLRDSWKLKSF